MDFTAQALFGPLSYKSMFTQIVQETEKADIVLVVSAGNTGTDVPPVFLEDFYPASLESPTTGIIVVGAVDAFYREAPFTTRNRPGSRPGPSINIWANGFQIQCASSTTPDGVVVMHGTSFAAPQVAGLAANFMALPGLEFLTATPGSVAGKVKKHLIDTAYKRKGSNANVLYNEAEEGLCGLPHAPFPPPPPRVKRQETQLLERQTIPELPEIPVVAGMRYGCLRSEQTPAAKRIAH